MNNPLLSVCLITYNHANYIRDAIEGVLMQKVKFPWELIIADDYSTDGTREIVQEYKKSHNDFIKIILQEKNVGGAQNWIDLITTPKSKYIAYFEGDDYWTDPYKLQKQVDYLENNPDYGLIHSDCNIWYEYSGKTVNSYYRTNKIVHIEEVSIDDILLQMHPIFSCTVVLRKKIIDEFLKDINFRDQMMADTQLWCKAASMYRIKYLKESTSVRRLLNDSASRKLDSPEEMISFTLNGISVSKYLVKKYNCNNKTLEIIQLRFNRLLLRLYFWQKDFKEVKKYKNILKRQKHKFSCKERAIIITAAFPILFSFANFLKMAKYKLNW